MYVVPWFFFCDREHANKKIETHKNIDGDIYVQDLDLLGNTDSFRELEYDAYLTCCFVQFFFTTRVIFVHLVLWVDLVVGCTEESRDVLVWLEQRC